MLPEQKQIDEKKRKDKREFIDEEVSDNPYYLKISNRYKLAKYAAICLLVLYLLFMIAARRDDITVENFRYLFKYLDMAPEDEVNSFERLTYDSSGRMSFALYRGDVAVAGESGITIYDTRGNSVMTAEEIYENPILRPTNRYMLTYDLGGNHFSIYNSFTQLYTETLDYPINAGAMSEEGAFAIATRTLEYKSSVRIYDRDFREINTVSKDKYVASVDITDRDGGEVIIASYTVLDGEYYTEVMLLPIKSDAPRLLFNLRDRLPMRVSYTEDGGFMLLTDTGLLSYNYDGTKRGEYPFTGMPADVYLGDDYAVCAFNRNLVGYNNSVVVLDLSGRTLYSTTLAGQIIDIDERDGGIFLLLDGTLTRIDPDARTEETVETEKGTLDVIALSRHDALVCHSNHASAYYFDVDEKTENETEPQ